MENIPSQFFLEIKSQTSKFSNFINISKDTDVSGLYLLLFERETRILDRNTTFRR